MCLIFPICADRSGKRFEVSSNMINFQMDCSSLQDCDVILVIVKCLDTRQVAKQLATETKLKNGGPDPDKFTSFFFDIESSGDN